MKKLVTIMMMMMTILAVSCNNETTGSDEKNPVTPPTTTFTRKAITVDVVAFPASGSVSKTVTEMGAKKQEDFLVAFKAKAKTTYTSAATVTVAPTGTGVFTAKTYKYTVKVGADKAEYTLTVTPNGGNPPTPIANADVDFVLDKTDALPLPAKVTAIADITVTDAGDIGDIVFTVTAANDTFTRADATTAINAALKALASGDGASAGTANANLFAGVDFAGGGAVFAFDDPNGAVINTTAVAGKITLTPKANFEFTVAADNVITLSVKADK